MKQHPCQIFFIKFLVFALFFILFACSEEVKEKKTTVQTIKPQVYTSKLFYSGIIQPLKILVVPSPADGVIMDMVHQYGEYVEISELLFKLSSTKFLSDYKTALMQYIKAKNEFNTSQMQLSESAFLHKNGLISDDDFKTKQSNYYATQLALVQAKDSLQELLLQLEVKDIDLYKLTIADIDKITQAMHLQITSENLRVLAPVSGILLSSLKSEENAKKLMKGDVVKQGDVLAIIGDMSGLSVQIKVNELTINQLKVGDKVKVTGIAFPEYQLEGEIKQIDRQGEVNMSGLPTFSIVVVVPKLSAMQQKVIHVGMTAKVEIEVREPPNIIIPIKAITEKEGKFYASVIDKKSHKVLQVAVKTGKSTLDSVSILHGLKVGDNLVIPD